MNDWFRSWHGAPANRKWRTIAKRSDVPTSLVVALAWDLLDRASQAEDRGSIAGFDPESFADFMDCDTDAVARVLDAMREKDFLTGDRLSGWERRQPKREREDDGAAERQRDKRARDKAERATRDGGTPSITPLKATSRHVTPREEERRLDTDASSLRSEGEQAQAQAPETSELRSWLGMLVGEEPVLLDLDVTSIAVLLDDQNVTRPDVEAGIGDAIAKSQRRFRTWSQFEGWIRTAAKNRLAGQARASPGPSPAKTDLLEAARRGGAIGQARAEARRQAAQSQRLEAVS